MKLQIIKNPNPILRKKAAKIKDPLDKEIQELILNMTETMQENNGVGLAAPQVGKSVRLCVIEADGERYVLINPKITSQSRKKVIMEEGCLSFPGQFFPIERSSEVQVRFIDEFGKARKIKCKGLPARAMQHEIDHLDGILIVDKIKKSVLRRTASPIKKKIENNIPIIEKDLEEVKSKNIKPSIVFMGTSDLSEIILFELMENGFNIKAVFTKPDKKIGREQKLSAPPVKILAEKNKIPVFQPVKFTDEIVDKLKELKPDMVIAAAYGKIIPKKVLDIPEFGSVNVHVSLLPKFRGPSPVQNALLNGEIETGVTIMFMDEGVDTGDIISQEKIAIEPLDNTATLMKKLANLGSDLLLRTIPLLIERKIQPQSQDNSLATMCQIIERDDGHIYWSESAESIFNRFRALTPWPGIFSYWKNNNDLERIKLLSIGIQKINPIEKHTEGEIFELGEDIGVQTAEGVIILKEVQKEGKKPLSIREFLNGYPDLIGSILQ